VTDRASIKFVTANDASRVRYLLPLARLLMSSLFIWDDLLQLRNPSGTTQYLARMHVPVPDLAIWISIPIHLIGGLPFFWVSELVGLPPCLLLSA
jgi:uncharacterized membrane protein YphA (DoxX/SURF4 family)